MCRPLPKLPAVEAGESISAQVAAFVSGWSEALKDISTELSGLAKNVDASKTVTIQVEQQINNRFSRFD